jgi:hypothetical protein
MDERERRRDVQKSRKKAVAHATEYAISAVS